MWLVEHNRCWISNSLAKHGMDHPEHCPLCDQHEESTNHLLVSCVFVRQFWEELLRAADFQELVPQTEVVFKNWWRLSNQRVDGQARKGFNSLVILGAWVIWKLRNGCVFGGSPPRVAVALQVAHDETLLWTMAGAKGLSSLQFMAAVG
jgi:hypothetical protein